MTVQQIAPSDTATSLLESLPVELLERICEYRLFFRTVKLSFDTRTRPLGVALAVDECIVILERNSAFAEVRNLVIDGRDRQKPNKPEEQNSQIPTFGLPLTVPGVLESDKDRLYGLFRRSSLVPTGLNRMASTEYTNPAQLDTIWGPLAGLLQKCQNLSDLVWACFSQVPPCLLLSLRRQPRCRLHVIGFKLDSLLFPTKDSITHDLALVRAPFLHSIWAWYEDTKGYDGEGRPSYYAEAILAMLQGLAPNLKEVHVIQMNGWSPELPEEYGRIQELPPCPPWKGFPNVQNVRRAPAQLESLELGFNHWSSFWDDSVLEGTVMDGWVASTQLSHLRTLTMSRPVSYEALQTLVQVGNNFPYLTTLVFICDDFLFATSNQRGLPTSGLKEQELEYCDLVKRFLHGLPQLTSLEIIKWHPNVSLAPALHPRLQELWVRTRHVVGADGLDEAAIDALAARRPLIKTLAVMINRSRGDATEVALYRAIGRGFPNLRYLDLTLDASPPAWFRAAPPVQGLGLDTTVDPTFDEFDSRYLSTTLRPYRNGHIRNIFINSAVDENLARAIFDTISRAQPVARLKRMSLQVEKEDAFPHWVWMAPPTLYLRPFLSVLRRRWLLERDVHHDSRHVIHVQEIDGNDRDRQAPRDQDIKPIYLEIFRRIWPERPCCSGGWLDDWQSLPLAV